MKPVGILLRAAEAPQQGFTAMRTEFELAAQAEPLLPDIESGQALAAAGAVRWWALDLKPAEDRPQAFGAAEEERGVGAVWDLCHEMVEKDPTIEFAEPDLEQTFDPGLIGQRHLGQASSRDTGSNGDKMWYREAGEYDGLSSSSRKPVRVAHLDTGYLEGYEVLPRHLRTDIAVNTISGEDPTDARDVTRDGLSTQAGHGTATMALLASSYKEKGKTVGVAPFAEVVPFRVANRVYHLRTRSIARAFDEVHRLNRDSRTAIHVVSMSMGGWPSDAWASAINQVYEDGTVIVTAAGNNINGAPTYELVYPARFERVIAATGVMANGEPYHDLGLGEMTGNYGPPEAMGSAIAAYTPDVPWIALDDPKGVTGGGGGTSSATPQVAGAAAWWIREHRDRYDAYREGWQKVEAVRHALLSSAAMPDNPEDKAEAAKHFGKGTLKAARALAVAPPAARNLTKRPPASARFSLWRLLPNLFADGEDGARRMLALEAEQLMMSSQMTASFAEFSALAKVPDADLSKDDQIRRDTLRQGILDRLKDHPLASRRLRAFLGAVPGGGRASKRDGGDDHGAWRDYQIAYARTGIVPEKPAARPLRVYAIDPSMEAQIATFHLTEATLAIPWEEGIGPGPVGEYLEVIDVDPASGAAYAPVDLNDHRLLAQDGLAPSETNPQFHQQMAYAVAMCTIDHFEKALGRVALWAPRRSADNRRGTFVRRLRIHPHGARQANAYYSIQKKALLFGYFRNTNPGGEAASEQGTTVFTCLSHDVIAHETSHALLDGLHSAFAEPTSKDVLAFHEAFADIVALFQHFTMPEVLRDQIARTGGDLRNRNLLAQLAVQFGQALGRVALRDYIGSFKETKNTDTGEVSLQWKRSEPSRSDLDNAREAHMRGAVLVGAVFDAFLEVFELRTRDDVLMATGGTGLLGEGALPPVLVERLAQEAATLAGYFLTLCIRALDYCPPVDINFGDYLRALVTAEKDMTPTDEKSLRVALISAFRERGIFPADVNNLTVDALMWRPPPYPIPLAAAQALLGELTLSWSRDTDRAQAFHSSNTNADIVEKWLLGGALEQKYLGMLGFLPVGTVRTINGVAGTIGPLQVHSVRPAIRATSDGRVRTDIVVEMTQSWITSEPTRVEYKGGCTVLIDPGTGKVRYFIRKRVGHSQRVEFQMNFMKQEAARLLACNYCSDGLAGRDPANPAAVEPFALLHDDIEHARRGHERTKTA